MVDDILTRLRAGVGALAIRVQLPRWIYDIACTALRHHLAQAGGDVAADELPRSDDERAAVYVSALTSPFLTGLSSKAAEAVLLVDVEGLSIQAAMEQAGLAMEVLKGRLCQGRRKVRVAFVDALFSKPAQGQAPSTSRAPAARCTDSHEVRRARLASTVRELLAPWVADASVDAVVTDVLQRLHAGLAAFDPRTRLPRWIYGTARSALLDHYARAGAPLSTTGQLAPLAEVPDADAAAALAELVLPIVEGMPREQAEAVQLIDIEGAHFRATARRLGVHVQTFMARLRGGRLHMLGALRDCLTGLDITSSPEGARSSPSSDASTPERFLSELQALVAPWAPGAEADRVSADILDRLEGGLGRIPDTGRVAPWLYEVVRSAVLAHLLRKRGLDERARRAARLVQAGDGGGVSAVLGCMSALLAGATQDQATALRLVDLQGLSFREAAQQLGICLSGAKQLVFRARARLQAVLRGCLEADAPAGEVGLAAALSPVTLAPGESYRDRFEAELRELIAPWTVGLDTEALLGDLRARLRVGLARLRPAEGLDPWLYRVIVSTILDHHRPPEVPRPAADLATVLATGPDPSARPVLCALVSPLLSELTRTQMEAFELTDIDAASWMEAMRQLGIARGTLCGRLREARRALRRSIQACCTGLPRSTSDEGSSRGSAAA